MNEDYANAKNILDKLLASNLSNYEKFTISKYLCLDHNYYDAKTVLESLLGSTYNDSVRVLLDKIDAKFAEADQKLKIGLNYYEKKRYDEAIDRFKEVIRQIPTYKRAHLFYAYSLKNIKSLDKALNEVDIYLDLEELYPSKKSELYPKYIPRLLPKDAPKLIKTWQNKP